MQPGRVQPRIYPVSYTHLDVYKRQPLLTAINWLANNLSVIGPILLGLGTAFLVFQVAAHWTKSAAVATAAYHAVVNLLSIGFGVLTGNTAAVSYTHLDVYKRQVRVPLEQENMENLKINEEG